MAKTKFKFTHADGSVSTRSSDRQYTHVVVGRIDLAIQRENCTDLDRGRSQWDFTAKMANVDVEMPDVPTIAHLNALQRNLEDKEFVAKYPDREAYAQARLQESLDYLAERYGTGDKSNEIVLQWSASETSAQKGAQQKAKYFIDVAVKSVDPAQPRQE